MGIRIHKCLGYALDDVESEGYKIVDERFNLKDGYFSLGYEDRDDLDIKDFYKYLKEIVEKDKEDMGMSMLYLESEFYDENYKDRQERIRELYDCFIYDFEYGLRSVVMFQPHSSFDWSRHDDVIDYYEAKDYKPTIKFLKYPIYPYDSWVNLRDMSSRYEYDEGKFITWNQIVYHIRSFINKKDDYVFEYVKKLGFKSIVDFKENVIPVVPDCLVELLKFYKVFNDEKTIHTLKPAIYIYWS